MKILSEFVGHFHGDCLVNHKHKVFFIPIPKNASTSFRRMLPTKGFVESNLHKFDYSGYESFAVLRHPISRFVSGYIESNKRRYSYIQKLPYFSMPEGKKRILAALEQIQPKFLDEHLKPQTDFLRGFDVDRYLIFENLKEQFSFYNDRQWFGNIVHSVITPVAKKKSVAEFLTPVVTKMIKTVYEKDFMLYERHNI